MRARASGVRPGAALKTWRTTDVIRCSKSAKRCMRVLLSTGARCAAAARRSAPLSQIGGRVKQTGMLPKGVAVRHPSDVVSDAARLEVIVGWLEFTAPRTGHFIRGGEEG